MRTNNEKPESILKAERLALEEQMARATETGQPQCATVDGKKVVITDVGRAGRQIVALEEIESVV